MMEVSYLATSPNYENSNALCALLEKTIEEANKERLDYIALKIGKNQAWLGIYPWFFNLGFKKCIPVWLSKEKHSTKAWVKNLKEE